MPNLSFWGRKKRRLRDEAEAGFKFCLDFGQYGEFN